MSSERTTFEDCILVVNLIKVMEFCTLSLINSSMKLLQSSRVYETVMCYCFTMKHSLAFLCWIYFPLKSISMCHCILAFKNVNRACCCTGTPVCESMYVLHNKSLRVINTLNLALRTTCLWNMRPHCKLVTLFIWKHHRALI